MESLLSSQPGVIEADASFLSGSAVVVYDPDRIGPRAIVEAVNTRTFYRARPLAPGETPPSLASGRWVWYGAALVLIMAGAAGVIAWRRRGGGSPDWRGGEARR